MPPTMAQLTSQVDKLAQELDNRAQRYHKLETYYDGESPFPTAITAAKVTQAYRRLMPVADAPWGSLVVGSVLDRLQISGIRDADNDRASDAVWNVWQSNQMDGETKLAHESGLLAGRVFALVWPDADGDPQISLDTAEQMIVQYAEGSRTQRVAALRRWEDADSGQVMTTLYRPDGIYKFQARSDNSRRQVANDPNQNQNWEPRNVPDEEWPVPNPFDVVPVVEVRFNPRLKAGIFGHARGEYEHCLGLIDRINLLTFLGLVVAFWMGFPIRAVIGDRILRDDDGNIIPPFTATADSLVQLENPNVKLDSFPAADRSNLFIYPELSQLAAITKTPRHYFPLAQAMANLSADAIRADEGALTAKTTGHKASAGRDWLEVMRLNGVMIGQELTPRAQVTWLDLESRSLAERADAATKLKDILPWQMLAETVLNMTQDDIARLQALKAGDMLSQLMSAAAQPTPGPGGSLNGSGDVTPDVPASAAETSEIPAISVPEPAAH